MLNVTLDRRDLMNLVLSESPCLYNSKDYRAYGDFWGTDPKWRWDEKKLESLSEQELWMLYQEIKKDWIEYEKKTK